MDRPTGGHIQLETHSYDGLWGPIYLGLTIKDALYLKPALSIEDTLKEIRSALKHMMASGRPELAKLTPDMARSAFAALDLIERDKMRNLDPANKVNVEDILSRVWRFVKRMSLSDGVLFFQQLADIVDSGTCPQGRSTRMFQLYASFMGILIDVKMGKGKPEEIVFMEPLLA